MGQKTKLVDMRSRHVLFYFLLIILHLGCKDSIRDSESSSDLPNEFINRNICQTDSLSIWIELASDYIAIEPVRTSRLNLSLKNMNFYIYEQDSLVLSGKFDQEIFNSTRNQINSIHETDINRIYNTENMWMDKIELTLFCSNGHGGRMIKSFGKHDYNPKEVEILYKSLLGFMGKKMREDN